MTITTSDCSIDPETRTAIAAGLEVANVDSDVVVAGDFVGAVRKTIGSTTYDADRGSGIVAAKTVRAINGPMIIFNNDVVSEMPAPEIERLAAHEAGHVLLYDRGEHVGDYRHLVTNEADWHLLCISSVAAEEFRIESALSTLGYRTWTAEPLQHMAEALAELNFRVVSSVIDKPTVGRMRDTVLAAQDVFAKVLAYAAGAQVSGGLINVESLASDSLAEWNDLVGRSAQDRLELWLSLPDAWNGLSESQWSDALLFGLKIERAFLERLGFHYGPAGPANADLMFVRIGSDELFSQRLERARRDFQQE